MMRYHSYRPQRQRQGGVYLVEFSVAGAVFFLLLFAALETGRLLYTWNVLGETTRRAARVATVCPTEQVMEIRQAAVLEGKPLIAGLTTDNLSVDYLDRGGGVTTVTAEIWYVRAQIVNFEHRLLLPLPDSMTLSAPSFTTIMQRESLGDNARGGLSDCSWI